MKTSHYIIAGAVAGAFLFGAGGGLYGSCLYFNPTYRETLIRQALSKPHPDSPRYVASITSLRYETCLGLVALKSAGPLLLGVFVGSFTGTLCWHLKHSAPLNQPLASGVPPKSIEFLVAFSICAT